MALTPSQQAAALELERAYIQHGGQPQRAREFALAAFHESGLRRDAVNPSSGAAGYLQLLSPGYRRDAQAHGGLFTTEGQVSAIGDEYQRYWAQHPNAPVGQAAAVVEASGEPASWYGAGLEQIPGLGGQAPPAADRPFAVPGATHPAIAQGPDPREVFARGLLGAIHGGKLDTGGLLQALGDRTAAVQQQRMAPASAGTEATNAPTSADAAQAPLRGGGGAFVFPVAGGVNFTNTWGAPRADTGHHEGVDIFAARGTPVVAITGGVVTKMGPSAIGGNRVWINGTYYYAHLDGYAKGVQPGSRVQAGQVIGYVGDTGDARGTPTHLHFGWSPNGSQGASWANPYGLLVKLHGR